MPSTLKAILRPYFVQRPALQRWTIFPTIYRALLPVVHTLFEFASEMLERIRPHFDEGGLLAQLNTHLFRGKKVSLRAEFDNLVVFVQKVHSFALRAVFCVCLSPEQPLSESGLYGDLDALLSTVILQRPVSFWLTSSVHELLDHVLEVMQVLPTVPVDMNPRVRGYVRRGVQHFVECDTLDAFLMRLRGTDWILRMVGQDRVLTALLGRLEAGMALWPKREILYHALRSVVVIPSEVVSLIQTELRAQRALDSIEHRLSLYGYTGLEHIANARMELDKELQKRYSNTIKHRASSKRHPKQTKSRIASRRRQQVSCRNSAPRGKPRHCTQHAGANRTTKRRRGGDDGAPQQVPLSLRSSHYSALRELQQAGERTASLLQGLSTSSANVAGAHTALQQKRRMGEVYESANTSKSNGKGNDNSPSLVSRIFGGLRGSRKRQRETTQAEEQTYQRALQKHELAQQSAREAAALCSSQQPSSRQLSLLDFSVQQMVTALLTPFHISHSEWGSQEGYISLVYHLQMLGVLPPVMNLPHDRHMSSDRACKHVKDLPEFGLVDRRRSCLAASQTVREMIRAVYYTLVKQLDLERHATIDNSVFGNQRDVQEEIEELHMHINWLRNTYIRGKTKGTTRASATTSTSKKSKDT